MFFVYLFIYRFCIRIPLVSIPFLSFLVFGRLPSLLYRIHAPAPPVSTSDKPSAAGGGEGTSVLGLVPHQLRGYLAEFRNMHIVGAAYDKCTGCSETVSDFIELYLPVPLPHFFFFAPFSFFLFSRLVGG